ncbi:DUF1615 domain-containing protein [Alcaligenaceae bacterium C4P045]|nr:DUF1615 domain-containing protein [Alcaligenaceae bacterium C4P045]
MPTFAAAPLPAATSPDRRASHLAPLYRSAQAALGALMAALVAGCATPVATTPERTPDQVRSEIERLIPAKVADRSGWARDIYVAFSTQDIAPTRDNLCAALSITEQESTFQADPPVAGLARIARAEIDRRAQSLHVPAFLVDAALGIQSSNGKTYGERLRTVKTEKGLSEIFDDFVSIVPLGRQLFGGFNPVRTGGPMQVSIAFAQSHAADYPYPIAGSVRDEVFTRRGGMYFGIGHLLGYPANYDKLIYRYADFNAGWYASRNAGFQSAVSQASGITLALDGDLITPGSRNAGQTELAVRALGRQIEMNDNAIRRDLERGDTLEFEQTDVYERVFALAERTTRRTLPRAVLPGIKLESPKITRPLTTAWFANRVDGRWQQCMARDSTGG